MSKAQCLKVANTDLSLSQLDLATRALHDSQLVVLPTDTVYGLACRADEPAALERLFAVKGRSAEKALPVLVAEQADLRLINPVADDPLVARLSQRFWPGPLTLILPKAPHLPDQLTGGQPTIGVRMPDLLVARQLLAACPFPVAVTSANTSGAPPARRPAELPQAWWQLVSIVIDGGPAPGGQPSTVLDLTRTPPLLRRPGPVTLSEIVALTGPCHESSP